LNKTFPTYLLPAQIGFWFLVSLTAKWSYCQDANPIAKLKSEGAFVESEERFAIILDRAAYHNRPSWFGDASTLAQLAGEKRVFSLEFQWDSSDLDTDYMFLPQMPNLERLTFNPVPFKNHDKCLEAISKCQHLEYLDLVSSEIDVYRLSQINKLGSLRNLKLRGGGLKSKDCRLLQDLKQLEVLNLTAFENVLPEDIEYLSDRITPRVWVLSVGIRHQEEIKTIIKKRIPDAVVSFGVDKN
jgi:hypothetical protein